MVGSRVRFLFTRCGESQTNERVFERVKRCTGFVYEIRIDVIYMYNTANDENETKTE